MTGLFNNPSVIVYSVPSLSCISTGGSCYCPVNYLLENGSCRYFPSFNINIGIEIIIIVGMILLSVGFFILQFHIDKYVIKTQQRQKLIDDINLHTNILKKELMRYK
jgi:hypothetical protein